jgi:pyruvate,water dikinase
MQTGKPRNPVGDGADGAARARLWTKALSQEFWAGAVTPLMFSIAGGLIQERMAQKGVRIAGLKQLEDEPFLKSFGGQVYLNSRILEEVVRLIPSVFVTQGVLGFLPEAIREDLSRVRVPFFSTKTLHILLRLFMIDADWAPSSNYKAYEKAAARIEEAKRVGCLVGESELGTAELLERSRGLYQEMGDFLDVVSWGVVFAYLAQPLTELLAEKWGNDSHGELAACLGVGLEGVKTFEINRTIETLAEEVRCDPWLNELFDLSDGARIVERLRHEQKATHFLERFQTFLEENGHRFLGRDISYPTWRERPERVIELIKMNRGSDLCRRKFALQQEQRKDAERELTNRIGRGALGPMKRALFSLMLSWYQRYFVIRENMRYHADIHLEQFRRLYLEIGRRLKSRGMLQGPEDIVFLGKEEIDEACKKGGDILQAVEERRREYQESLYLRTPEVIRDGEGFPLPLGSPDEERFVLNGETASPGRVAGPARIIRQPEDLFAFQEGDIVVAQYTDPSWAPVLSLVSGLVLEVGGLLSHGAIVAREYGIPALIQVDGAVERIRNGDRLELDTERGCVRVLRKGVSA